MSELEKNLDVLIKNKDTVAVSFRLEFYSRGFMEFFKSLRGGWGNRFSYRLLSGEERYRIDLASLANQLGTTEDELSDGKCYIFDYESKEDPDKFSQLIVGEYFIYIYVEAKEFAEEFSCLFKFIKEILNHKEEINEMLSPNSARFSCVRHQLLSPDFMENYAGKNYYNMTLHNNETIMSQQYELREEYPNSADGLVGRFIAKMEPVINDEGKMQGSVLLIAHASRRMNDFHDQTVGSALVEMVDVINKMEDKLCLKL